VLAFAPLGALGEPQIPACDLDHHLTGKYPNWWQGRRWDRPVKGWAGSESSELTRDGVQRMLVGPPKIEAEWGTGLIPGSDLVDHARRQGVPDSLHGIVASMSAAASRRWLQELRPGPHALQAETLDFVWFDEEPPMDLYTEWLTRTNATGGIVWLTFTPLLGMSEVVYSFDEACGPL
jgi:phage terminase large subunit-like protein